MNLCHEFYSKLFINNNLLVFLFPHPIKIIQLLHKDYLPLFVTERQRYGIPKTKYKTIYNQMDNLCDIVRNNSFKSILRRIYCVRLLEKNSE